MGRATKTTITGAALAALLAIVTPSLKEHEGLSTVPYKDQVGKLTVCYGETNVRMRRYTKAECDAMLDGNAEKWGRWVAARNPELVNHPHQWAAATSLAYNIGMTAYNRSSVAANFTAGHWRAACNRFTDWKYAGGKINQGLLNRRLDEKTLCLKMLPEA